MLFSDFFVYSINDKYARFILNQKPDDGLAIETKSSGDKWIVLVRYGNFSIIRS